MLTPQQVQEMDQIVGSGNSSSNSAPPQETGLDKTLGSVPLIGGVLKGMVQPVEKTATRQAQNTMGVGPVGIYNPYSGGNQAGRVMDEAGTVGTALSALDLPGVLNAGKTLLSAPKMATFKGVANAATKAATKATDRGAGMGINDIIDTIMKGKMSVGQAQNVPKMISESMPNSMKDIADTIKLDTTKPLVDQYQTITGKLNPTQMLEWRRSLLENYGPSLIEKFGGLSPEKQSAKIIREELSKMLKTIAPEIKGPDKIYSLYKTLKGSPAQWAGRLIGGTVADKVVGSKLHGLPEGVVDVLGTILGNMGGGAL